MTKPWADGDPNSPILILAEAPTRIDMRMGRPFCGPVGDIFTECLHVNGIARRQCYIVNLWQKPVTHDKAGNIYLDGDMVWQHKSCSLTEAGYKAAEPALHLISQAKPNIIAAMGQAALSLLADKPQRIMTYRGSPLWSRELNVKYIPTVHPQTIMMGNYLWRYMAYSDLEKVKRLSTTPEYVIPDRRLIIEPSLNEILEFMKECRQAGIVATDLEVINQQVSCFSLCHDPMEAMTVPLSDEFGAPLWTLEQEARIWTAYSELMADPDVQKINQNIVGFDIPFLVLHNHIYTNGFIGDTMIAQHILYPDFPKGLDFICSVHTDEPYYKDEGKMWKGMGGDVYQFWRYCAKDAAVALEAWFKLKAELTEFDQWTGYNRTVNLVNPLTYMTVRGLKVNLDGLAETKTKVAAQIKEKEEELAAVADYPINPNSPKQVATYFYEHKGLTPYKSKTGGVTTDDKAMSRIVRRYNLPEARLIQQLRALKKLKGTYLDVGLDYDNRIRCSWNPRGTNTGRLSSSQTIRGTGMNLQNLHPEFKDFIEADEGYVLVEFDLAGAEWVIVAYLANDENMIEIIEKDLDPHATTAVFISHVDKDLVLKENKIIGSLNDPDKIEALRQEHLPELFEDDDYFLPRTMSLRQMGKKSNHGLNYFLRYKTFALQNEIDESDAKVIVDSYSTVAYPNISEIFWKGVRDQLKKDRTLTNLIGSKRRFLGEWGVDLFQAAYAYIPQSTVGQSVNDAMILAYDDKSPEFRHMDLLAQVHDSILIQFPLNRYKDMAKFMKQMAVYLSPELEAHGRKFHIRVDAKMGFSWGSMKGVDLSATEEELAEQLKLICAELRS